MGRKEGKDGDRKPQGVKASSSAQAAEFLASRGAQGLGFGGFSGGASLGPAASGFGFGAAAAVRPSPAASSAPLTLAGAGAGGDAQLSAQLDGEVAQCLRHLSKKDAVTKLKALQALRGLIKSKPAGTLTLALAPWTFLYARLCQDPSRAVRTEATATLGELVSASGKAAAPHIKALLPLWWLAQFDPHADAAAAARSAFQACFPGKKQQEALRYCTGELLTYLWDQATANAQQLGDARKDTPEEMEERYERVVSAALLALGTLLQALAPPTTKPTQSAQGTPSTHDQANGAAPAPAAQETLSSDINSQAEVGAGSATQQLIQVWSLMARLLSKPGYMKSNLNNKSPLIRAATYTLVREVAADLQARAGGTGGAEDTAEGPAAAAQAAGSPEVAAAVLGVLGEKDPGNHGPMWAMLLTYIKAFPSCWAHVDIRKVVLPRLTSLLRHGCYGSHGASWPALLPLVSLMPRNVMEPSPDVPVLLLGAAWQGLFDASASRTGRAAGCAAYQEILYWLLVVVAPEVATSLNPGTTATTGDSPLAAEAAEAAVAYRMLLLQGSLQAHVLPAALGAMAGAPAGAADVGMEVAMGLVKRLAAAVGASAAPAPVAQALQSVQQVLASAAAAVVGAAAAVDAPQGSVGVFGRCEALVAALRAVHAGTANAVGAAVAAALVGTMQGGATDAEAAPDAVNSQASSAVQLPPAASQLLATLIRTVGLPQTAQATDRNSPSSTAAATTSTGAALHVSSLGLEGLLRACQHGPPGSSATAAHVQLLLSWLLGSHHAEEDWLVALQGLTGLPLTDASDGSALAAQSGNTRPVADVKEAPSLALVLLLVTSLADSLALRDREPRAEDSPHTPHAQPWEKALDALAAHLCTEETLNHAANAGMGAASATAAVTSLAAEPSIAILSALMGACGSHALLVSPARALQVAQALCTHACTATVSPASCAAQAIARALFAPAISGGARPTNTAASAAPSPRVVFMAASMEMSSLLVRVAELAWRKHGQTTSSSQPPYVSSITELRKDAGSASEDEEDSETEEDEPRVQEVDSTGLDTLAMQVAVAAWSQGHALRTAAAGLDRQNLSLAVKQLVAALLKWLMEYSSPTSCLGSVGNGRLQDNRAAVAAGYVQHMAGNAQLQQVVLGELLLQLGQLLGQLVPSCQTGVGSSRKPGRHAQPVLSGDLMTVLLFMSHVVCALGPEAVTCMAGQEPLVTDKKLPETLHEVASSTGAVEAAGVLVHLLAAESSLQQPATGMDTATRADMAGHHKRVLKTVHIAVQALIRCMLGAGQEQRPAMQQAMALAYAGASQADGHIENTHLRYPQPVYCSLLLCFLQHLTHGCNDDASPQVAVLEDFCAVHLLPAGLQQQQQQIPHLPAAVLEQVLSLVFGSLRCVMSQAAYASTSLPRICQAYMAASLAQPPVTLDPASAHITALQLANACFPTASHSLPARHGVDKGESSKSSPQAFHASGLSSPSPAARVVSPGLDAVCTTYEERQQLLQLLRHQAVRHGALAAAKRLGAAPTEASAPGSVGSVDQQQAAVSAVAALECSATAHGGRDLQEAEWHTVLSDMQGSLSAAVQAVRQAVEQLAEALRSAAAALLASGTSQQAVSGAVALQLLRQLDQRGLLQQHPAYPQLKEQIGGTLKALQLSPALQAVLSTVHVLLSQMQLSAATRADQLPTGFAVFQQKYRQQFGEVCEELLGLLLATGTATHLCDTCGTGTSRAFWAWANGMGSVWAAAGSATCRFLDLSARPGGAGLGMCVNTALTSADTWLTSTDLGLHALDVMLSLALSGATACTAAGAEGAAAAEDGLQAWEAGGGRMLAAASYMALLHAPSGVMSHLSVPIEEDTEGKEGPMGYEQGTDVAGYLIQAGLHPQLASVVGAPEDSIPISSRLAAWAVLLCHLASSSGGAEGTSNRATRHALGEVTHLVPDILNDLLQWLPLADYASGKAAATKKPKEETVVMDAAVLPDLRSQLRAAGVPGGTGEGTARLARVLYAGVLHALQASARTWFGDLRDRGTAVAVEAYTAAVVSPALLAAELQDVQSRSEELQGDQFNVRVSAAAREVVAQLVVEEGSSLELAVKLPPSLPLKPPEVECRRRVGVNDTRMRKWLLSISAFLRTNNRGVADAITMWRSNVESEFEGVEPCLICYSIVAATNSALPKLQCNSCRVRFHPGCLYKWFKSSGKSACPHCQSPW